MRNFLAILIFSFVFSNAEAVLLSGALYVALDKGGSEARKTINSAHTKAQFLLDRGDKHAQDRLEQFDEIIMDALAEISKLPDTALPIIEKMHEKMLDLEKQLMVDIKASIFEFECSNKRFVISDLQTALGGLGKLLGTHTIEVVKPARSQTKEERNWCIWCSKTKTFKAYQDFKHTFEAIEDYMLTSIDEHADENTPADAIVGTYEYLGSLALVTSCFYPNNSERYIDIHLKYKSYVDEWSNLVKVKL